MSMGTKLKRILIYVIPVVYLFIYDAKRRDGEKGHKEIPSIINSSRVY
jgi:hypothetical protein